VVERGDRVGRLAAVFTSEFVRELRRPSYSDDHCFWLQVLVESRGLACLMVALGEVGCVASRAA
jgi:hypothetical protein